MTRHLSVTVLLGLTVVLTTACVPGPASPEPTVTVFQLPTAEPEIIEVIPSLSEVLADTPELSTFGRTVNDSGLLTQLENEPELTLFAPSDAAFAALPPATLDGLISAEDESLSDLLMYHGVPRIIEGRDVGFNTALVTLLGESVMVEEDASQVIGVGGATLVQTDIAIANGTVHIIDRVLEPSTVSFDASIADVAASRTNLSTLSSALDLANLTDTLDSDIEYTILAPTNNAFNSLPEALLTELDDNPLRLAEVLTYHVILGRITAEELAEQRFIETVQGQTLYITNVAGGQTVNGQTVLLEADIEASNGLVHIVDRVLLPTTYETEATVNIAEIIGQRAEFSTMLAAVLAAGYGTEFQAPGQYTLLAPTNQAFANLPEGELDRLLANPDAMREVILYHTLPGVFTEGDINAATSLATIAGPPIIIEDQPFSSEVLLNGTADLQLTNLQANNGIVHQVNQVLLPPVPQAVPSLADIVAEDERLTTLAEAAELAGIRQTLVDTQGLTLLAPTDTAFESLPDGTLELLLVEPEDQLQQVLLYHMLPQPQTQEELIQQRLLQTLAGSPILLFEQDGEFTVNGARFNTVDIEASNGVVHLIDSVILPTPPLERDALDSAAEVIAGEPDLSIFASAVEQGEYTNLLTGEGPFTIFAPTNAAFEALDDNLFNELFANPPESLRPLLLEHITLGAYSVSQVAGFNQLLMASGTSFPTVPEEEGLDTTLIVQGDIGSRNATIHQIDRILGSELE